MLAPRNKDWAKRITRLMEAAGLTVERLADDLGVGRSTVYSWKNGTRIPSPDNQPVLAKRLRTTVVKLNGWA